MLSKFKVDLKRIEKEFIDIVKGQAEENDVQPEAVAIVLFPKKAKYSSGYKLTAEVLSLNGAFEAEEKKVSDLTIYDKVGKPISKAIMEILKTEVEFHNKAFDENYKRPTHEAINERLSLPEMEVIIRVKPNNEAYDLDMSLSNVLVDFCVCIA
jgi:hypothetical protein